MHYLLTALLAITVAGCGSASSGDFNPAAASASIQPPPSGGSGLLHVQGRLDPGHGTFDAYLQQVDGSLMLGHGVVSPDGTDVRPIDVRGDLAGAHLNLTMFPNDAATDTGELRVEGTLGSAGHWQDMAQGSTGTVVIENIPLVDVSSLALLRWLDGTPTAGASPETFRFDLIGLRSAPSASLSVQLTRFDKTTQSWLGTFSCNPPLILTMFDGTLVREGPCVAVRYSNLGGRFSLLPPGESDPDFSLASLITQGSGPDREGASVALDGDSFFEAGPETTGRVSGTLTVLGRGN